MANKRDKIARRRQIAKTRKGKTRTTRSKPAPPPRDPEDAKKQRMIDLWIAVGIVIVAIVLFLVLRNVSSRTPDDSDITAETATPSASEEATLTMEENVMSWSQPPEMAIDLEKDYRANIKTAKGDMLIDLREDLAPVTVNNFVFLAREGFYDGVTFHRVMAGFMAQTGDPTGTGAGGPGYRFADEFSPELRHDDAGIVSMANAGANTNGSQFFITYAPQPHLNDHHSVFGKVLEGMDVLNALTPRNPQQNPSAPPGDEIITIEIIEQ